MARGRRARHLRGDDRRLARAAGLRQYPARGLPRGRPVDGELVPADVPGESRGAEAELAEDDPLRLENGPLLEGVAAGAAGCACEAVGVPGLRSSPQPSLQ